MNVVGYVRVSTTAQGESGRGLDAQREAILRRYPDAVIAQDEVKSGARADNRPVLRDLLAKLRRGDALVVSHLDRLARDSEDFARINKRSIREGWALVLLDLGLDTSTPIGEAMAAVGVAFGRLERRRNSERVVLALETRRPDLRERRLRVQELAADGLNNCAIARDVGCHRQQVARILAR